MIEERLQQVVEAEQRARAAERATLKETADLQALREQAREEADLKTRDEVSARKKELEAQLKEHIQSDLEAFRSQYARDKSAIEQSAHANQDALTTWLWEEVIRQYGRNADAETSARHDA